MTERFEIGTARHHLHQLVEADLFLGVIAVDLTAPQNDEVIAHCRLLGTRTLASQPEPQG